VNGNNVVKDIMFGTIGYLFGRHEGELKPRRMPAPFKAKIVVTMPSWAIPLIALATGAAVYFKFSVIVNVIELLIVCGAFLIVVEMSRIVARLRYRVNHMMNGIDEDAEADPEPIESGDRFGPWMDEQPSASKKVSMRKVNGNDGRTRV
jgi:hypothetical protein